MKLNSKTSRLALLLASLILALASLYAPRAIAACAIQARSASWSMPPACGTDGKTYGNSCEASRACVEVAYQGACIPQPPACMDMDMDGYSSMGGR